MPTQTDWIGALIVGGFSLGTLLLAEVWRYFLKPSPELTRKFVHFTGGINAILIPLWIKSFILILSLGLSLGALYYAANKFGWLKSVFGVKRKSSGGHFFPLAVILMYYLTQDQYWLYVASLVVLTAADSSAALIGNSYGRFKFFIEDNQKSVEGTTVFFLVTFISVHLTILLMTDIPRLDSVVISAICALLVTMIELTSLSGWDNIFIPLSTWFIIQKMIGISVQKQFIHLAVIIELIVFIALIARAFPTFNAGGAFIFSLFMYAVWALGDEQWLLPSLASFIMFVIIKTYTAYKFKENGKFVLKVRTLFYALLPSFVIAFVARMTHFYELLYPAFLTTGVCIGYFVNILCFPQVFIEELTPSKIITISWVYLLSFLSIIIVPILYFNHSLELGASIFGLSLAVLLIDFYFIKRNGQLIRLKIRVLLITFVSLIQTAYLTYFSHQ